MGFTSVIFGACVQIANAVLLDMINTTTKLFTVCSGRPVNMKPVILPLLVQLPAVPVTRILPSLILFTVSNWCISRCLGHELRDSPQKIPPQNNTFKDNKKFGWPTAVLFLAPAEGWKGPSGPAGNLCPLSSGLCPLSSVLCPLSSVPV